MMNSLNDKEHELVETTISHVITKAENLNMSKDEQINCMRIIAEDFLTIYFRIVLESDRKKIMEFTFSRIMREVKKLEANNGN